MSSKNGFLDEQGNVFKRLQRHSLEAYPLIDRYTVGNIVRTHVKFISHRVELYNS